MSLADAALAYCRRGWAVIPLRWTGDVDERKRPLLDSWEPYQRRPATEEQVRQWWAKWPSANIGLITGKVSGLVALDLDGPNATALIQQAGIFLPKTASVKTGKGFHALYRYPGTMLETRARVLKDGAGSQLDVRADGGYVVAPPSIHGSGHIYTWIVQPDEGIEVLPEGMLRLLSGERQLQPSKNEPGWVAQALRGVPEGQRDEICAKLAGYFLAKGVDADTTEALLLESFARNCQPVFPPTEVRKTVRSIQRRDARSDNGDGPVGVVSISQALDAFLVALEAGPQKAIATPFGSLNRYLSGGFAPGELIYLAGRPGSGKTALALEIARKAASLQQAVLVVSREMVTLALTRRLLAQTARINAASLKSGRIGAGEQTLLDTAIPKLRGLPLWMTDKALTIGQIADLAVSHEGLSLLIVDYLQLVRAPYEIRERRLQVEHVSQALKELAVRLEIPVLCLSSLSRSQEAGRDKEPTLDLLRESGELEYDADIVLFLHRKPRQPETKCIIAKNRDGREATVNLIFRVESVAFDEVSEREE